MRKYNKWTVDSGQWTEKKEKLTPHHSSLVANEKGMALVIIVAIIAILSSIGVTFMYTMRMEEKAAFNYMSGLKSSYIAQSGIEHAIAVLKSDGRDTGFVSYEGSRWGYQYDDNADSVFSAYYDSMVDYDNDNCSVDNDTPYFHPDLDDVQGRDSRWIYVEDENGDTVGRYAVLIIDESSKININTVGNVPISQGWKPFEINLKDFFDAGIVDLSWDLGGATSQQLADEVVLSYRYGPDGAAGNYNEDDNVDSIVLEHDGIDNNADGQVDEEGEGIDDPYEFIAWKPYIDITGANSDTPFITNEEIKEPIVDISGVTPEEARTLYQAVKPYITVYSSDENTTDSGFLRLNINLLRDAMALYTVMYDAWTDLISPDFTYAELKQLAAQCAVNTIDYADTDNVATFLEISESDGTDTTIARGVEAIRINEIMVKPAYQWEAEELFDNGLALSDWDKDTPETGIYCETESATIIVDMEVRRAGFYRVRALTYGSAPDTGIIEDASNTGIPPEEFYLTDNDKDWDDDEWESGIVTIVSGDGAGQTRWIVSNDDDTIVVDETWDDPTDLIGAYYSLTRDHSFFIRLKSEEPDIELEAGKHNIGGWLLEDLGVVEVREVGFGEIELETSQRINEHNTARLDYIQFSRQPDCEYVELINISDNDVDIGGWVLATSGGWVGTIPDDTIIKKRDYIVLVVDSNDTLSLDFNQDEELSGLRRDNIHFENTWPGVSSDRIVQLKLSTPPVHIAETVFGDTIILAGSIFEDSPLSAIDYPDTPMAVTLYKGSLANQEIVSQVDYSAADVKQVAYRQQNDVPVYGFVALEKDDPNTISDSDTDGVDDWWNYNRRDSEVPEIYGGTPGGENSICTQNPALAVNANVPDLPFATVGDIRFVSAIVTDSGIVTGVTTDDTLTDSFKGWENVDWTGATIKIVEGEGAGQIRKIIGNGKDTVWVDVSWDVNPSPGSTYRIHREWSRIGYDDLGEYIELVKRIADKITVSQKRLEAENNEDSYTIDPPSSWNEIPADDTFLTSYYSTNEINDTGVWVWGVEQRIHPEPAVYDLYLSGRVVKDNSGSPDTMLVQVTTGIDVPVTREISFSSNDIAYFGQITIDGGIPDEGGDTALLRLEMWKDYLENTICFDAIILSPEHRTYGRININTADKIVLYALGLTEQQVVDVIDYRDSDSAQTDWDGTGTYLGNETGVANESFKTIGEILNINSIDMETFSKISNLITTKSKIFTIISTGQALRESDKGTIEYPLGSGILYEILGEKKYMVVMER